MSEDQDNPQDASDNNDDGKKNFSQGASLTLRQRLLAMTLATVAGIGMSFVVWQIVGSGPDSTPADGVNRHTGIAAVGGPFELVTQDNVGVSEKDFMGKYMLIYFGYTWCPDVCPLALQFMDDALTRVETELGPQAEQIQPVFITIDPERDTPEVIKAYLSSFHPDLIGLTGSQANIDAVAAAYKMYFRKTEPLDPENPMSYGLDHMNIFYLMGPDGAYVAHFMSPTSPKDVAASIASHLQ